MRLRFLLPPNLPASAPRDAIAVRLEVETDGQRQLPERVPMDQLGELDDADRAAAFVMAQWCGGKLASLLQLDRKRLGELLAMLEGRPSFFWASRPNEAIRWADGSLAGVSQYLVATPATKPEPSPAAPPNRLNSGSTTARSPGEPMLVDGSEHFLAIQLPSKEHPLYAQAVELVKNSGFQLEPSNRRWWLRDRHKTLAFLSERWNELRESYAATFTENFRRNTARIRAAEIGCEVTEGRNGYEAHLSLRAGKAGESEIRESLASGRPYFDSGDAVYLLDRQRMQQLQEAQRQLAGDPDRGLMPRSAHRISPERAAAAEELLEQLDPNFSPPAAWRARSLALRQLDRLAPVPLSPELERTLRPYQRLGASWLHHLYRHELGGILADEMGLGKTLQTIALLAAAAAESAGSGLSLVVCPASLVENWRRELARFAPHLRVFAHHGANRLTAASQFSGYDVAVTSYGTLLRDQELFGSSALLCVIADEAQHIKNRKAQNAQALRSLRARARFALTGTPIENTLEDLRSLMDFALPGAWQATPSDARGEARTWHEARLRRFAAPYILRRTKAQVAPELPPKIEQTVYCELAGPQATLYERVRLQTEAEIDKLALAGASEGALRMKALAQLLRLRQVCCDPRLLDEASKAEHSAKLEAFREVLDESIDGGHRLLVFSQFTSLLALLREELEAQGLPYLYLDGSTPKRQLLVDRFNEDASIPVFLISLKAGGAGLNLTGADTVVHFDPWWNPAVEAQATDRAHRIGQTRAVTSIKLIVAGSVEERVLQLQESKRRLLADVFEESDAAQAALSIDELRALATG
jgi:superfamily II DNA or RNA helicase